MDTKVTGSLVLRREVGNLLTDAVTFYNGDKPAAVVSSEFRTSYQGYKTDKDKSGKRENMAVQVARLNPDLDTFQGVEGHKFLSALIADYQDVVTGLVADGELDWNVANDAGLLIKEYFDTSRNSSGRKVTKESIAAWFLEVCTGFVSASWFAKNPQGKEETCGKVVKGFAEMFSKLTSYNLENVYTPVQGDMMARIVAGIEDKESEMAVWVAGRIAKLQAARIEQDALTDSI